MYNPNLVQSEEVGELTVSVMYDECGNNPRNWDNLGKMVCSHKRHEFPNEIQMDFDEHNSWDEVKRAITKQFGASLILAIWLYEHSGLSFSTESFYGRLPQGHAEFDSGKIGFIFVTKEDIRKEYGKAGKKEMEKAEKYLQDEVEMYGKYANGECYIFSIEDADGNNLECVGDYYDSDEAFEAGIESAKALWEEMQTPNPTKIRKKLEDEGQLALKLDI
jgi:hypothetical protein